MSAVAIHPLQGLPEIGLGDPLGELIAVAVREAGLELADGDAVVVSQKVVSKAEGRVRSLAETEPGERARGLAAQLGGGKDPRMVELVLEQSRRVVRAEHGVLIVETHGGWICANGGVDASNLPGDDLVALLPADADASARRIRAELEDAGGARPAVVVADSFGRPWRHGQAEVAIGCAGLAPLEDWRGRPDGGGRLLRATQIAVADQAAAAADLVRGKDTGEPAVRLRGLEHHVLPGDGPGAAELLRAADQDLFA